MSKLEFSEVVIYNEKEVYSCVFSYYYDVNKEDTHCKYIAGGDFKEGIEYLKRFFRFEDLYFSDVSYKQEGLKDVDFINRRQVAEVKYLYIINTKKHTLKVYEFYNSKEYSEVELEVDKEKLRNICVDVLEKKEEKIIGEVKKLMKEYEEKLEDFILKDVDSKFNEVEKKIFKLLTQNEVKKEYGRKMFEDYIILCGEMYKEILTYRKLNTEVLAKKSDDLSLTRSSLERIQRIKNALWEVKDAMPYLFKRGVDLEVNDKGEVWCVKNEDYEPDSITTTAERFNPEGFNLNMEDILRY